MPVQISLTPLLLAVELGFVYLLARRTARTAPVYAYLLWLVAYGFATTVLGARGVYVAEVFLTTLPGLWLSLVTIAAVVVPVILIKNLRDELRQIVDQTPWHWFAYFHGLRIGALGTAYKTWTGEFPAYFEYAVGVPDFIFGVSAFWIAGRAKRGTLGRRGFLLWNAIGVLIILPAPLLIQLGLPGPLQVFTSLPDARAILTYPMCIAPVMGVPLFALINLWVAWRLWETDRQDSPSVAA